MKPIHPPGHNCAVCDDPRFKEIFGLVAKHVADIRTSCEGFTVAERSDFVSTYLHASTLTLVEHLVERIKALEIMVAESRLQQLPRVVGNPGDMN